MAISPSPPLDVLVVGAGPTGLTLAAELSRHGLSVRLVDQLTAPVVWSKAAVVHARTMEIFDAVGVAPAMLERCTKVHGINLIASGKRVLHVTLDGLDSPYPHVYGVSQRDTEAVLAAHVAALGVPVERGVRLDALDQDEDGVVAGLVHEGGRTEEVRARYLVGCDGAHSKVREALAIPFEGASYEERLLQADIRVTWPKAMDDDEIVVFLHPDGPLACFPLFADGRYRLIAVLKPGAEVEPTLETFQRIVAERAMPDATVSDPAWMVAFRIHCRMVPRYRDRRVFLAGDAAHIHSPAGGQGMNTGIQDAYNLAWKLALVARGTGRAALLDAYEAERRPIARATLDATDQATRRGAALITLRHPIAVTLRDQLLGVLGGLGPVQGRLAQGLSMLHLDYRASPIVRQDQPASWGAVMFGHASAEAPSLLDWMNFGQGPAPGDRVSDVALPAEIQGRARLFDRIRGTKHTLLLFDGAGATAEGYATMARVARETRARHGREVEVQVVLPMGRKPKDFAWDGSIVNDGDGALHRAFGARSECLYLIRPDGHVAYRCQPIDGDKLASYLNTVLVPSPAEPGEGAS